MKEIRRGSKEVIPVNAHRVFQWCNARQSETWECRDGGAMDLPCLMNTRITI